MDNTVDDMVDNTVDDAAEGIGGAAYCDHCGAPLGPAGHDSCHAARRFEPPRYCATCRRRLVVQVTPRGWSAHCSAHGPVDALR